MTKKSSFWKRAAGAFSAHKVLTGVIVVTCTVGAYGIYRSAIAANVKPQYVLAPVMIGSITQAVAGSGQVSAENQLDVTSQVSGTIQAINVSVGTEVHAGDLLATIDPHDALVSLENARLAYAKLVQPAKAGDLANSENTLAKAYNDGWSAIADTFLGLPNIMSGLKSLLYDQNGFLNDQHSVFLTPTGQTYRATAGISYDKAVTEYMAVLQEYKSLTRGSATSSIDSLLADTYLLAKNVANALQSTQTAITFIMTSQPDYYPSAAVTAASNVTTWSNQTNSNVTGMLSAQNTIASTHNSLKTLVSGADTLDVQSQQLSLQQAEDTYKKYFIRAPFDGIVGRIPVSVYGQASGSTVVATIIGNQKIASISLNEVDAAKVQVGQPVTITFDAIDGLNATGTVSNVDLVGTVSQGVVSYGVKIIINTSDPRIKPGMSVNTTIITNKKDNVLIVPSSALKTQGNNSFVQVFDAGALSGTASSTANGTRGTRFARQATTTDTGTTTTRFNANFASSSNPNRQFLTQASGQTRSLTISSAILPRQVMVTIGISDDTNTEIVSGLTRGELVVTRTTGTASAAATAAPSILNSLGGNRGGAAGRAIPGR